MNLFRCPKKNRNPLEVHQNQNPSPNQDNVCIRWMNIAFFNTKSYEQLYFDKYNTTHTINYLPVPLNERTASLAANNDAVCCFVNDRLNAETIRQLKSAGIKLIAMRCAGFNNVDLKSVAQAGIKLVRVPAYSPYAVAEHAVALILTLNRKTHKSYNRVREGNFSLERLMGFDLHGKSIGVIGTGKIGSIFAAIMKGFGCHIYAYDVYPNDSLTKDGVKYVQLEELLSKSDIISLHCPLMPETKYIINSNSIQLMKHGAMLINTSRGGLIETSAVVEALKSHQLGYLGIDVYEQEENLFFSDLSETIIEDDLLMRLMSFPNVLITSHQGFFTEEALTQIAQTTLANISAFESGRKLDNEVACT
jgi:D-lactate dehydrogenase